MSALAAFNERRTTARLAREDQKRAQLAHFRQLDQAARTATYRAEPQPRPRPASARPARKVTTPKPRRAPAEPRRLVHQQQIRPCVTCKHPTRPNQVRAADAPNTRPRLRGGECTTCGTRADRADQVPKRRHGPRLDVDIPAMVAAYTAGKSLLDVAEAFALSKSTARRYLTGAGVTLRDDRANRRPVPPKQYDPAMVDQVRTMYVDQGLSQDRIANHLGCSSSVVSSIMTRHDIPVRGPGGRPGVDQAADFKAWMASEHVTAAQVRAWARTNDIPITTNGLPSRPLVEQYLTARGGAA